MTSLANKLPNATADTAPHRRRSRLRISPTLRRRNLLRPHRPAQPADTLLGPAGGAQNLPALHRLTTPPSTRGKPSSLPKAPHAACCMPSNIRMAFTCCGISPAWSAHSAITMTTCRAHIWCPCRSPRQATRAGLQPERTDRPNARKNHPCDSHKLTHPLPIHSKPNPTRPEIPSSKREKCLCLGDRCRCRTTERIHSHRRRVHHRIDPQRLCRVLRQAGAQHMKVATIGHG